MNISQNIRTYPTTDLSGITRAARNLNSEQIQFNFLVTWTDGAGYEGVNLVHSFQVSTQGAFTSRGQLRKYIKDMISDPSYSRARVEVCAR